MPLLWYALLTAFVVAPLLAAGLAARVARRSVPVGTSAILVTATVGPAAARRRPVRLLDPDAPGRPRPRAPSGTVTLARAFCSCGTAPFPLFAIC